MAAFFVCTESFGICNLQLVAKGNNLQFAA